MSNKPHVEISYELKYACTAANDCSSREGFRVHPLVKSDGKGVGDSQLTNSLRPNTMNNEARKTQKEWLLTITATVFFSANNVPIPKPNEIFLCQFLNNNIT